MSLNFLFEMSLEANLRLESGLSGLKRLWKKFLGIESDFGRLKRILSLENGFGGDFSGQNTKSAMTDFCKVLNGVITRFNKKSPDWGLWTAYKIRSHGFLSAMLDFLRLGLNLFMALLIPSLKMQVTAGTRFFSVSEMILASSWVKGLRTWWLTVQFSGGRPTPILILGKFCVPMCWIMDSMPWWPPPEPFGRSLIIPSGKSISSWATTRFSTSIL